MIRRVSRVKGFGMEIRPPRCCHLTGVAMAACLWAGGCGVPWSWGETGGATGSLSAGWVPPQPVQEADVEALKANSPFLRPIDLSQTMFLSGVAREDGHLFATLQEKDSKKSYIVSDAANAQGWRLIGVAGDQTDLKTVSATIAMAGGEEFTVHFGELQLNPPEPKSASRNRDPRRAGGPNTGPTDYRQGISGDGFRGPPPPEVIDKLSKLSDERRERLIRQIGEIRSRNPEMSSDDRRLLFTRMLDRAVQQNR